MRNNRRVREDLSPDITPLIDIVFLLLVFFMVSSVFKKEEAALLLTLPKSQSKVIAREQIKTLVIEISGQELAVNRKVMTADQFRKLCATITNKNIPIDLRADKKIPYEKVTEIIGILQKNNLTNLSLITDT